MNRSFAESAAFVEWVRSLGPEGEPRIRALQNQLRDDPDAGKVIRGGGGFRKLRLADPDRNKGKRGGLRIVYPYLPEAEHFYMAIAYDKNERGDLDAEDRKTLAGFSQSYRDHVLTNIRRYRTGADDE